MFAADVIGGGPHALGLPSAASGLGALSGALYLASRSSVLGLGRVVVVATLGLGLALVGFSQSGALWLSAGLLVLAGAGMMVQMAAANTMIQTMVDEDKRGLVMGFFGMAFQWPPRSAAFWPGGSPGRPASAPWSPGRGPWSSSAGWSSPPSSRGWGGTPARWTPGSASCRRRPPG